MSRTASKRVLVAGFICLVALALGAIALSSYDRDPVAGSNTAQSTENARPHSSPTGDTHDSKRTADRHLAVGDSGQHREVDLDALLTPVPTGELETHVIEKFIDRRSIERFRVVEIDTDTLREIARAPDPEQQQFALELFPGESFVIQVLRSVEYTSGPRVGLASINGAILGEISGRASVYIAQDDSVTAHIRLLDHGAYELEHSGQSNYHIVWQWDPTVSTKTH